jgi:hypothetical protein
MLFILIGLFVIGGASSLAYNNPHTLSSLYIMFSTGVIFILYGIKTLKDDLHLPPNILLISAVVLIGSILALHVSIGIFLLLLIFIFLRNEPNFNKIALGCTLYSLVLLIYFVANIRINL